MKYVSVADLKAKLSGYLQKVKEGEALYVTSHGHPVAQLVPLEEGQELGIRPAQRPVSDLKRIKGVQVASTVHMDQLLRSDRDRR